MGRYDGATWTAVVAKEDVTQEVFDLVWGVIEGWYDSGDRRIDWEDVFERTEASVLADGSLLDWGPEIGSPAMREVQRRVRKLIRET